MYHHNAYHVQKGDRIVQLVVIKIATPPIEVVSSFAKSARGNEGFGSTGLNTVSASQSMLIFEGKIKGQTVDVLIDSGASGNFISEDLVKRTTIKTRPASKSQQFLLADGTAYLITQKSPTYLVISKTTPSALTLKSSL